MEYSKNYMAEQLKSAIDQLKFRNVIFTDNAPIPQDKRPRYIRVGAPRLLFPTSGSKLLITPVNHQSTEMEMYPGDIIFVPANSWTGPLWKKSHTMISLTFYPTHIRILSLKYEAGNPPPVAPDIYYHSNGAVNQAGQNIIHTLTEMAKRPELRFKAEQLIEPLLELTLYDLNNSKTIENSKSYSTWCEVLHCMMENYHQPISSKYIAKRLCIDAGYVSKLLKKFTGIGFSEYLTQIRISHAEEMLKNSRMTLDEIAFSCGYKYTSYFIRVFNKMHGVSPSQYRQTIHRNNY